MKISIIHPTLNRIKIAQNTFRKWTERAADWNNFEYILSLDYADENDYRWFAPNKAVDLNIIYNYNTSAVEAINNAAKKANGDIFIIVSDDTDCPEHWDLEIIKALKGHKADFCAKTDDGLQPTLITMPIMDRIYYERYGYVYFPEYRHMWVDTELTAVAIMTGKYIKLDLKFEHLHYSTGKTMKDGLNARNDSTWKQGERLFNERLKTNFGISNPVIPYSEIKWK